MCSGSWLLGQGESKEPAGSQKSSGHGQAGTEPVPLGRLEGRGVAFRKGVPAFLGVPDLAGSVPRLPRMALHPRAAHCHSLRAVRATDLGLQKLPEGVWPSLVCPGRGHSLALLVR